MRLKYLVNPEEYSEVIYGDTDSCMIKLKTLSFDKFVDMSNKLKDKPLLTEKQKEELQELKTKVLEESFEKGKVIAQKITEKLFKKPIELCFEKCYHPYILLSKKKYIGNYYESSIYKPDKVEKKGIVLSRRDNANIVKKIYTDILNPLLDEGTRGINISISILRKYINDMLKGEADINDLVITKTLTKTYGKPCKDCDGNGCEYCKDGVIFGAKSDYAQTNSPHVQICINKRKKDPGSAPVLNDRISYVFVNRPDKPDAKLYEKAEELETVITEGLELDYLYYIQNQIQNPLTEILQLIVPTKELEELFSEYTKDLKTKRALAVKQIKIKRSIPKGQQSILKWIVKKERI